MVFSYIKSLFTRNNGQQVVEELAMSNHKFSYPWIDNIKYLGAHDKSEWSDPIFLGRADHHFYKVKFVITKRSGSNRTDRGIFDLVVSVGSSFYEYYAAKDPNDMKYIKEIVPICHGLNYLELKFLKNHEHKFYYQHKLNKNPDKDITYTHEFKCEPFVE